MLNRLVRYVWCRIFGRPAETPESVAEVERLMADVGVGGRVLVRDVSGGKLAFTVTDDADYNRKLCNALFKVSRHDFRATKDAHA